MKRILVSLGAVAMSFAIAAPALAIDRVMTADRGGTNTLSRTRTSVTTVTTSQTASLSNTMSTTCNSGGNTANSVFGDVKGATITSGNSTCGSTVNNTVNKGTVTVNAPTTVGSESAGPTVDYFADRGGDNVDAEATTDVATVGNSSEVASGNSQTSLTNTGDNHTNSVFGDVGSTSIISGVANGLNTLTQDLNTLMLTVIR